MAGGTRVQQPGRLDRRHPRGVRQRGRKTVRPRCGADAALARQAAEQASADAAAARTAATQAEVEAERARGAATRAENEAAAASSAAALAEREAATAQSAATQAEQDAADAGKLAESAEAHAKSAEEAAKNANAHAKEADEAAKRTEEYARELERKARENAARTKTPPSSGATPSDAEQEALRQAGITPEQLAEYRTLAEQDLIDYLLENGGELLVELFLQDILDCIDDPDIPTCLWAIISSIPVGKLAKVASKLPRITKAIAGIGTFLDKSAAAKKRLKQAEEIIEKVRKKVPDCLGKKKKKPGPKGFAPRSAAAKADDDDECLTAETVVYRSPATGKRASEERGLNPANHGGSHLHGLLCQPAGGSRSVRGERPRLRVPPLCDEARIPRGLR
ncbi:hypothetical protein [Streptomyces cyaneofuscatus]|uniref:hypothetical protein n=1 Tax=Streptomyces cyaneofuscatus TaxID=66883 RepID=UPI0033A757A9